jgi:hypothetical protein
MPRKTTTTKPSQAESISDLPDEAVRLIRMALTARAAAVALMDDAQAEGWDEIVGEPMAEAAERLHVVSQHLWDAAGAAVCKYARDPEPAPALQPRGRRGD